MDIYVDFFKPGGKWSLGGEVEINDDIYLFSDSFKQEIVNNQNIITEGWQGHYFVVTSDTVENHQNVNYKGFFKRLFQPWEFAGINKTT